MPKTLTTKKIKKSAIKILALVTCAFFIAAMLASFSYILTHANHKHDHCGQGGTCAVCVNVSFAKNLVKQLSTAGVSAASTFGGLFFTDSLVRAVAIRFVTSTPIALKVRLNN